MRPQVIAHRGNSWPVVQRATDEGADLIEVDVQVSADGVALLRHPYALADGRLIPRVRFEDVVAEAPEVMRLDTLLDWLTATPTAPGLILDIKNGLGAGPKMAMAIGERIVEVGLTSRVFVAGWDHAMLATIKGRYPELSTMAFLRGRPVNLVNVVQEAQVDAVSLSYDLVTADDVTSLHRAGVAVNVEGMWRNDFEFINAIDADMVSVDDVAQAVEALRQ